MNINIYIYIYIWIICILLELVVQVCTYMPPGMANNRLRFNPMAVLDLFKSVIIPLSTFTRIASRVHGHAPRTHIVEYMHCPLRLPLVARAISRSEVLVYRMIYVPLDGACSSLRRAWATPAIRSPQASMSSSAEDPR